MVIRERGPPVGRDMPEEVIQVGAVPSPVNVTEAMAVVHAGLGFLAAADAAQLPCEVQAQCLQGFEQADAMSAAGRAVMLGLGHRRQGPSATIRNGLHSNRSPESRLQVNDRKGGLSILRQPSRHSSCPPLPRRK